MMQAATERKNKDEMKRRGDRIWWRRTWTTGGRGKVGMKKE